MARSGWIWAVPFCVGLAALVYQVAVLRITFQIFGVGIYPVSAIICNALLGLAIGALSWSLLTVRLQRPTRVLAIGLALAACWILLCALSGKNLAENTILDSYSDSFVVSPLTVFLFGAVWMIPANAVFGAVIPAAVEFVRNVKQSERSESSSSFAIVYALETAGAAAGSLLAGFLMIERLGITWTLYLSAIVAAVSAILVLATTSVRDSAESSVETKTSLIDQEISNRQSEPDRWGSAAVLLAVFLAGCAAMGMEVVWQRYLAILFGSDTHSFAIVAALYLIGITVGSTLARSILKRNRGSLALYGLAVAGIAASGIAATLVLIQLISGSLPKSIASILAQRPVFSRVVLSTATLLVPTMLMGMALPLAVGLCARSSDKQAQSTGLVYAVALIGNVVGLSICIHFFVQQWGLAGSTTAFAVFCLLASALVLFLAFARQKKDARISIWQGIAATLLLPTAVAMSFLLATNSQSIGFINSEDWNLVWYREGADHTVAVAESTADPLRKRMIVDGVTIGQTVGGVDEKQQMLAMLPFLLHADQRHPSVLTIGLGTGVVANQLSRHPSVESVTCVELSPTVIEAARHFAYDEHDIFANPRINILAGDGIHFLRRTSNQFDVIVSDGKSRPGHAGNVAFFSSDYYRHCESRLSPSGVFVQWLSLETSPDATGTILRTFADRFPFGHVGIAAPDSVYLVGSRQPLTFDREHHETLLSAPVAKSLTQYDWKSADDFATLYWLDQSVVAAALDDRFEINTLNRPVLESFALSGQRYTVQELKKGNLQLLRQLIQFDSSGELEDSKLNGKPIAAISDLETRQHLIDSRMAALQIIAAELILLDPDEKQWLDRAADHYGAAIGLLPELNRQSDVASLYRQIAAASAKENEDREFSALAAISDLKFTTAADEFRLGTILKRHGRPDRAMAHFVRASRLAPEKTEYQIESGLCLLALDKPAQAAARFRRVLATDASNPLAQLGMAAVLNRTGDVEEAKSHLQRALAAEPELSSRLDELELGSLGDQ